jgi:glycine/D-amino acid oxidase-like deaminating enzyme
MSSTVAVIGGGIQGTLCALACSAAGWRVTLFERKPKLWQGASANNEGKIHLGFTYGLDRSGKTQARLAELGARFEAALAAILGPLPAGVFVARRVIYARHALSALAAQATDAHLESTARMIGTGTAIRRLPLPELRSLFSDQVTDAWEVPETTIEPTVLGEAILARIARQANVDIVTNADIAELRQDGTVWDAGGRRLGQFDRLLNCAWDGLARLHGDGAGFCLRGKAGFIARIRSPGPGLPVTFCFGPFGDIVPLGGGRCYVSWYPACLMGFTTDLSAGSRWFDRLAAGFDFAAAYQLTRHRLTELTRGFELDEQYEGVRAGPILAEGSTDIHDLESRLHRRTAIGLDAHGRIATINPGKLATAPWWASKAATWIQRPSSA